MARNNRDRARRVQGAGSELPPSPTNSSSSNVFEFAVPTDFIKLPSQGLFYSPDHPLYKQEVVEIKFMTAKEEDILTSKALLLEGLALDRLLQSVMVDKDIDIDSLLLGDKNALLIGTRITGYGSDYETKAMCPHCLEIVDHTFDLEDSLVVKSCAIRDDLAVATVDNTFIIKNLPRTSAEVEVRLLTGHDEKANNKRIKQFEKIKLHYSPLTETMRSFIVSVNGKYDQLYIDSFLENVPAMDARYLRKEYAAIVPQVELISDYVCGSCSKSAQMEVPVTPEFFWPK